MIDISIIGAGHLTKSLLIGLSKIIDKPIWIYNRTQSNIYHLSQYYNNLIVLNNLDELTVVTSYIFVIIPPKAIIDFGKEFVNKINNINSIIVSCANGLGINTLDNLFPKSKVIRILPNINWQIGQGMTIYSHNKNISKIELDSFISFLSPITKFIKIDTDEEFDNLGKLTSCGPGLITKIIEQLLQSFNIMDLEQRKAVYRTIQSTIDYLLKIDTRPEQIINEVSNKGGLTEVGIQASEQLLSDSFLRISDSMNNKIIERKKRINELLDHFCDIRGWDKRGIPTRKMAEFLDLADEAQEVEKHTRLE